MNAPGPTEGLPLNGTKRKAKQIEIFIQELRQHALSKGTDLVTMNDIYLVADDLELDVEDIQDFVDKLNDEGHSADIHHERCRCLFRRFAEERSPTLQSVGNAERNVAELQ